MISDGSGRCESLSIALLQGLRYPSDLSGAGLSSPWTIVSNGAPTKRRSACGIIYQRPLPKRIGNYLNHGPSRLEMFSLGVAAGQITSIALLAIPATLLLTQIGAAQRPAGQSPPSLIVTPSTSIAFSGPQGGPFSPSLIEYRVSASMGTISYSIRTPSWLTASSTSGTTDTSGVTITLTVNARASNLRPGAYGPAVAFTNVSNGQGSATRPAKLIIQARSPPLPTRQIAPDRGRYLGDDGGGYLLDDRGGRLLAQ